MHQKISFISILILLTSCVNTQKLQLESPEKTAKIRVFQGALIHLYSGHTCYSRKIDNKIRARASFAMLPSQNAELGMPKTEDIPMRYDEHIIPANKPLTISMYYTIDQGSTWRTCGPIGVTFTPEIGKLYDAKMIIRKGCSARVRELVVVSPGKAIAVLKGTQTASVCNKS